MPAYNEDPPHFGPEEHMDSASTARYLDGAEQHELFANVIVSESDNGLRFDVPPRIVLAPSVGKFVLTAYGARRWFKERDDYGEIRTWQSLTDPSEGGQIWIPHLYPFEEVDEKGLPVIKDVERCKLTIELQGYGHAGQEVPPLEVSVHTDDDVLTASENEASYNPFGEYYFIDFSSINRSVHAEVVEYPEIIYHTLGDYLDDKGMSADYFDIMTRKKDIPEEFTRQFVPNDWNARKSSTFLSSATGEIYVPMHMLATGIEAGISFPAFQPNKS